MNETTQPAVAGPVEPTVRPQLLTEKELLGIVDGLIQDVAYNRPAAVAIGMAVGAAVEAEVLKRLIAREAALLDVAMMLKRCAWALRRGTAPDLGESALYLLQKHNLLDGPSRDETMEEAGAAAAALYDRWTGKA